MRIPEFAPSPEFVDGMRIPCLRSRLRNSEVPSLGKRRFIEYDEDPSFDIFLLGAVSQQVSEWHQSFLDKLFGQEELIAAIDAGMKEFETSEEWCGYDPDDEVSRDIKRHGITAYLVLETLVLDDIRKTVIMGLRTEKDLNLCEHGITVFLKDGKWRFGYADYWSDYFEDFDVGEPPTSNVHSTEPSLLYGRWVFDESETTLRLRMLATPEDFIKQMLESLRGLTYVFSEGRIQICEQPKGWTQRLLNNLRSLVHRASNGRLQILEKLGVIELDCLSCELKKDRLKIQVRYREQNLREEWDLRYTDGRLRIGDWIMRRPPPTDACAP